MVALDQSYHFLTFCFSPLSSMVDKREDKGKLRVIFSISQSLFLVGFEKIVLSGKCLNNFYFWGRFSSTPARTKTTGISGSTPTAAVNNHWEGLVTLSSATKLSS